MSEHPIENIMLTAMNSIKEMIDVNTIIGEPIQASNNIVVIPISKVSFGFAAGGSEFKGETVDQYKRQEKDEQIQYRLPFGGGAGAGVSVTPVAFLVVQGDMVKLLTVNSATSLDKLLDYIPDLFEKASYMINKSIKCKKEQTDKIISTVQNNFKKEKKEESNEPEIKEQIKIVDLENGDNLEVEKEKKEIEEDKFVKEKTICDIEDFDDDE